MEKTIIDYLYQDKIRHAYIIKALEQKVRDFEIRKSLDVQPSYAAIWHDDQIITLHGDEVWCKTYFEQYLGYYSYYDIRPELMENLLKQVEEKHWSAYTLESHYLMRLTGLPTNDACKDPDFDKRGIKQVKSIKNASRYQFAERDGRILGSLLLEQVAGNVFIISEMIIKKPFRRQGHAYDFISRLVKHVSQMNQTMNPEFILYVDRENLPAYNLYLKLGFLVEDEFQNFVSND